MKTPKRVLMKKKIAFRSMPTKKLEELLELKKAELQKIQSCKKFYTGCYTDEENRLYYAQPVEQMIALIEGELEERRRLEAEQQEL